MPTYSETPISILVAEAQGDARAALRERFEASRLGGVLRFVSDPGALEQAIWPSGGETDENKRALPDLIIAGTSLLDHVADCLSILSRRDARLARIPILRLVTAEETVPAIPASPVRLIGSVRLPLDKDDMAHIGRILVRYWLELVLEESGMAEPTLSAQAA